MTGALTGCEPGTEPRPVDGTFVLRTVGSASLPALTGTALNTQFWVLADTIFLRGDGSGEWRSTTSSHDLLTTSWDTTQTVLRFDHRREGSTVRATDIICEPSCDVLPGARALLLEGDWLTLGASVGAHRYERIAPSDAL